MIVIANHCKECILGDNFSAAFLLDHGALVDVKRPFDNNTPLHLTSSHVGLVQVAEKLLAKGAEMDSRNLDGL